MRRALRRRLAAKSGGAGSDAAAVDALQGFCRREALQAKVGRELGEQAFSLRRFDYRQPRFESWRPLGLVAHITPANAPLLPFMAVLESLLAGNVNWLRPSGSDQGRSARLLADFLSHDAAGDLAAHVAVLPLATDQLAGLLARADAVSAWAATPRWKRSAARAGRRRWIPWGHRISFAYLDPAAATEADYDALADDVCRFDQQACSSPQCLLVDSEDEAVLRGAAQAMAAALARRAPAWPALQPDMQEAAEISSQLAMLRLDQSFAGVVGAVEQGEGWRVAWAQSQELAASPLFRTLQLPAARAAGGTAAALAHPFAKLRPDRRAGASAGAQPPAAGRRRRPAVPGGDDARRLRWRAARRRLRAEPADAAGVGQPARWSTARPRDAGRLAAAAGRPGRAAGDGQNGLPASRNGAGRPAVLPQRRQQRRTKLAGFSYRDYHRQMLAAADGLLAAGLDPAHDRVMNLLYGGNLYGGMLSFYTILDKLGVPQYPMGGPVDDDFSQIAHFIVSQGVNTLVGMPGTLQRLFECEEAALRLRRRAQAVLRRRTHQ